MFVIIKKWRRTEIFYYDVLLRIRDKISGVKALIFTNANISSVLTIYYTKYDIHRNKFMWFNMYKLLNSRHFDKASLQNDLRLQLKHYEYFVDLM